MTGEIRRADVILVEMPFTGSGGSKKRPAVVLSTEAFNSAGTKVIVVAITSNLSPLFRPGDTTLGDWQAAGLLKPSAVRGYLGMADKRDVDQTLGRMSAVDFAQVEQSILQILGLRTSGE